MDVCGPAWPRARHHRAHAQALPLLAEWTDEVHAVLADLGYEGERAALTTPIKTTAPVIG